ncbi:MAG: hypothetical protein KatS3mg087_2081 [Patescibacteria group bacterium]|nr:MAG: hypothetical protein KatS3mg087_2081 [Patescibacteria group bacterium]
MTNEQYELLKKYLILHPEMAALPNEVIANRINTEEIIKGPGPVPADQVSQWAAEFNVVSALQNAVANHPNKDIQATANILLMMIQVPPIHMDDPVIQSVVETLVQYGVITKEASDALLERAIRKVTLREHLDLPEVLPEHIETARKLLSGK